MAKFKQNNFMGALLDIQEAEKLPPKKFDMKTIQKLKLEIDKSFDADKGSISEKVPEVEQTSKKK